MDPLGDPLTTRQIQMGWGFTIEPYPGWRFGCIDNPDLEFVNGSVPTRTRSCSDGLEPLLTLGIPDIQILGATAFDNLLASDQVIWTFFLRVGDCTRLLGATVEGITDGEWDRPQVLDGRAGSSGSSCGRRVYQQCGPWMTATGMPRHEGSMGLWGLALLW